jgi:uncharacterized protein (DUF433 family)
MLIQTSYEHIIIGDGVPIIKGTSMKVVELVLEHLSYGWSPEELKYQHPYLELGQIYSALGYYYDHKDEFDRDIELRLVKINDLQKGLGLSALRKKLEAKGLL